MLTSTHMIVAVKIAVIVAIGFLAYTFVRRALKLLYTKEYLPVSLYALASGITRWLIIMLVIIMGLEESGVSMMHVWTTVSTVLVLIGVGFVALWSILSNILCALFLIIFAPFRIGDEIEVIEPTGSTEGLKGKVIGLNILYTTLEQISSENNESYLVEVPNNIFFQKTIRRVNRPRERTKPLKLSRNKE